MSGARVTAKWLRQRGTMIAGALLAMMALGAASWHLAASGLADVVEYRSPYTFRIEPAGVTGSLTRRLVLVIVDGLGFAGVDEMPVLKDIGSRGAAFSLLVSQPSLSFPGWTTLLSGAPPEISGVTTNGFKGPVPVDSLFDAAGRAGLKTALVADEEWKALLGASVARAAYVGASRATDAASSKKADDAVLQAAIGEIDRGDARFIVVHFSSVDAAGRASGAAGAAYQAASAEVDARIAKILAELDLTSDTMIVTSDHGHTPRGGHGGWEEDVVRVPFVAAGAGIVAPEKPGTELSWTSARHVDVAPTCAALVGASVPMHSQGRVLFEALDAPEHVASERAIRQAEAREAFARLYLGALGRRLPALEPISAAALLHNDGRYADATKLALEIDGGVAAAIADGREGMVRRARIVCALAGALLFAGLLVGLVVLAGRGARNLEIPVMGAAVYFAAFYALVFVRGIAFSMSMFNSESEVVPFFTGRMLDSAVCGALAAAVSGWLSWRARRRLGEALSAGATCVYLIVLALVVQAVVFAVGDGVRFTRYLPDLHRAFKYYVDLLQIAVIGASSPALAGLAVGAWWVARRAASSRRSVRRRKHHAMSGTGR